MNTTTMKPGRLSPQITFEGKGSLPKSKKAGSPSKPNEFMRRAIELSREGMQKGHGGPFGAVVVKDGKIIGAGFNRVLSSHDPTAHAEVVAIRNATKTLKTHDLKGSTIYTSCEPCPMCLGAIYWANINKINYAASREDADKGGFRDQFLYDEFARPIDNRRKPTHQMLRPEAQNVFAEWNAKQTKTIY